MHIARQETRESLINSRTVIPVYTGQKRAAR